MSQELISALILAAHPFLIGGALFASAFCTWAAWRLRDRQLKLWWLLVAIALISANLVAENSYYLVARSIEMSGRGIFTVTYAASAPAALFFKLVYALGSWVLLYVGLAVNWEKAPVGSWVRRMLLMGSVAFVILYPLVVMVILWK